MSSFVVLAAILMLPQQEAGLHDGCGVNNKRDSHEPRLCLKVIVIKVVLFEILLFHEFECAAVTCFVVCRSNVDADGKSGDVYHLHASR